MGVAKTPWHLRCTVPYQPEAGRIHCACHRGVYNSCAGANLSGPPQKPLKLLKIAVNGTGSRIARIIDAYVGDVESFALHGEEKWESSISSV